MSEENTVVDLVPLRRSRVAFARLATLLDRREAEILADPIKHLGDAGNKIAEQAAFIESLRDELHRVHFDRMRPAFSKSAPHPRIDHVMVDRAEWEALQRIAAMIRARA